MLTIMDLTAVEQRSISGVRRRSSWTRGIKLRSPKDDLTRRMQLCSASSKVVSFPREEENLERA